MRSNTICIAAQFHPVNGLSKAVQTLYESRLREKFLFIKIDTAYNKRILRTLWTLLTAMYDIAYITPSQQRSGNLRDLLFLAVVRWRKKPCIVHIHGGYFRQLIDNDIPHWQQRLNYTAIRHLAGGIVLGNSLHHIFEGLLPDEKIFICPNCVDDAFIAPSVDEKLNALRDANEPLHILYLSNFIETKGYREIVELARMTAERGDGGKFVFHFAGKFFSQKDEAWFTEHTKDLQNVKFHGVVSGQAKVDLLRLCHIFALLSRYPNEGQPISILEAMGNGMAIVTTDHAGIPEIANAENGFACSKRDINLETIYHYLKVCYADRIKLAAVCLNNYDITKLRYTERQYVDNMDRIFEQVLCNK